MADPWLGERLGNYQIEALLGSGGMARVYAATHVALGTRHAVKVLDPMLGQNADVKARFLREGRIQAQFDHEGIARVTDTISAPAVALVMELLTGETLRQVLDRGPISTPAALLLVEDIAAALSYAHARGVVHRDIKPENIFLADEPDGSLRPVLLDFGVAHVHAMTALTQSGIVIGTPRYMSPEQIDAPRTADSRADVFSLAAVLYEMLAGFTPHTGDTPSAVMLSMITARFEPISRVSAAPEPLDAVLSIALAPDRDARFATMEDFVEAVTLALAGVSDFSEPDPTLEDPPMPDEAPTWPPISDAEVKALLRERATGKAQLRCPSCGAPNWVGRPRCTTCGASMA
ncbi:MAG: serine/threonine protein kinase [Alphaproteobacteria bacterium]|nr:serine/threonine protein kinase [Alphaproteobacteria bacterium]